MIRLWIKEKIGRGMITVSIEWKREKEGCIQVIPNLDLAKAIKSGWEKIAAVTNLSFLDHFNLSLLAKEGEIFEFKEPSIDEDKFLSYLKKGVDSALIELQKMKQIEGGHLRDDISKRAKNLISLISQMEMQASMGPEKYREKIKSRLDELFEFTSEIEEKIYREIALMAERSDYTEEIVRFRSHLSQLDRLLQEPLMHANETRGKTMEFLIQEFLRELHTIGSKGFSSNISELIIEAKGEVEKIREQVQNVE